MNPQQIDSLYPGANFTSDTIADKERATLLKEDEQITKWRAAIVVAVGLAIGASVMYSRMNFGGDVSKIEDTIEKINLENAAANTQK